MTNVKCTRCGVINLLSNEVCKACNLELSAAPSFPAAATYPASSQTQYRRRNSNSISSIGPFNGFSDVFGPTVSIFSNNIWLISKLVLVIVTPFEIFRVLSLRDFNGNWQLTIGTLALQIFCNVLIAPALIYALMKVMQTGETPGINESYRWGLSKLGKLCLCVVMAWALEALGSVMLIIPGIILMLAFKLVYPMAVLEEGSAIEILKRSYNLTKGHRLKILGATFVMSVLISFASAPVTLVVSWLLLSGFHLWPIDVAGAIVSDILSQGATVLSLVIYISILRTLESRQSVIE